MKFCWHKWKYLLDKESNKFLGKPYSWKWKRFRICLKCGKAQEINSHSQGFSWNNLSSEQVVILKQEYELDGNV